MARSIGAIGHIFLVFSDDYPYDLQGYAGLCPGTEKPVKAQMYRIITADQAGLPERRVILHSRGLTDSVQGDAYNAVRAFG